MSNVLFCYPNLVDTAILSAGAWLPTLPLTNLQDRRNALKARSVDEQTASSIVELDFGSDKFVRAVGIISHNLTLAATIRVRLGNDPAFASQNFDSGQVDFNAVIYPPGVLITGDPGESDDKLPQSEYDLGYPLDHYDIFNSNGRYMRVNINDPTNPDGYVEFGRLWASWGWQPTINMVEGVQIGWETSTTSKETDGGVTFHNERRRRRLINLDMKELPDDEALVRTFEMNRRQGGGDPMLFCYDPDDTFHLHRRTFIATIRKPKLLSVHSRSDSGFTLVEEL